MGRVIHSKSGYIHWEDGNRTMCGLFTGVYIWDWWKVERKKPVNCVKCRRALKKAVYG